MGDTLYPIWEFPLSDLPFHPATGLQAIGFTSRGPIWPVMGGSEGDGGDSGGADGQQQQQSTSGGQQDRGFPENTPVAEMSDAQKAAYYKHHNRQADNKLAAFKGVTPQAIEQMQQELETLRNEKLTADEKALKAAAETASADAKAAADAEWRPKYLASQLKSAAASVIKDSEQLASFMAVTDPAKFAGEDGEIDEEKVMGHLTALFGGGQQQDAQRQQQQRQWGQYSGGTGAPAKPGETGRAAAARRHGTKST